MNGTRWFYRTEHEWTAIIERLKQTACPHCQRVGTLNRHGSLFGYDDTSPRTTLRARRIFCSNRGRRPGCGRTVSVWMSHIIRRSSLTSRTLLAFLQHTVVHGLVDAIQTVNTHRSVRTWHRIGKRFHLAQSRIRTALRERGPPPPESFEGARRPDIAHVLAHLRVTFPNTDCPIAAFQHATGSFVL